MSGRCDDARIEAALALLCAAPGSSTAGERWIRADGSLGLVAAILREIDQTILAREIRFRNEQDRVLRLIAKSRRLLCLLPPAPSGTRPELQGLFGDGHGDPSDEYAADLRAALEGFTSASGTLGVKSLRPSRMPNGPRFGISAKALEKAWSLAAGAAKPNDTAMIFKNLTSELKRVCVAHARLDGVGIVETQGPDASVEALRAVCRGDLDKILKSQVDRKATPGANCIAFWSRAVPSHGVFIATQGAEIILMLLETATLQRVISTWNRSGL